MKGRVLASKTTQNAVTALCVLLYFFGVAGRPFIYAQTAQQEDAFETRLSEAQDAQARNDVPGAIAAYKNALSLRRNVPEVWANLGLMQHQAADYESALASFKTANQLQPKLFVPILFLGIENLELGRNVDAVRYLITAQRIKPDDFNIEINLGRAYFNQHEYDQALATYRKAAELNPRNGEAWYRLGITYLETSEAVSGDFARTNRQSPYFQALNAESASQQGQFGPAAVIYRGLVKSVADAPPCVHSSSGFILLQLGKTDEAQAAFSQDEKASGCSLAKLGEARLAIQKGDFQTAFASLAGLWALDHGFLRSNAMLLTAGLPKDQFVSFDHALAQSASSQLTPEAASILRQSMQGRRTIFTPQELRAQTVLGPPESGTTSEKYFQQGEYGLCSKSLLSLAGSLPRQKLLLLATCSYFTGDFETTLAAAKRLRTLNHDDPSGFYWNIRATQQLAVAYLELASEVDPNSLRLHELLADSYRDRQKFSEAESEYKVALSIDPNDFAALLGAAATYLQEQSLDLASDRITRALALKPQDPEANYIMGEVLIAEHKLPEAGPYLKSALTAKAELLPRVHALLGKIYAEQGDTAHAVEEYKQALPNDSDGSVHFQLGRLYQKLGETRLATAAFEESKALMNHQQDASQGLHTLQP